MNAAGSGESEAEMTPTVKLEKKKKKGSPSRASKSATASSAKVKSAETKVVSEADVADSCDDAHMSSENEGVSAKQAIPKDTPQLAGKSICF